MHHNGGLYGLIFNELKVLFTLKQLNMNEEFEPFNKEWEKEVQKHTKAEIIHIASEFGKQIVALREENELLKDQLKTYKARQLTPF